MAVLLGETLGSNTLLRNLPLSANILTIEPGKLTIFFEKTLI